MSKLDRHGLAAGLHAAGLRWQRFITRTTLGPIGTGNEVPAKVPMSRDRNHPGR
jgi:hypothetical protein